MLVICTYRYLITKQIFQNKALLLNNVVKLAKLRPNRMLLIASASLL